MTKSLTPPPQQAAHLASLPSGAEAVVVMIMKEQPPEGWRPARFGDLHRMVDGEFVMRKGAPVVIGWGVFNEDGDYGIRCPLKPGDTVAVKEPYYESGKAYQTYPEDDEWRGWSPRGHKQREHIWYRADGTPPVRGENDWGAPVGKREAGRTFFPDAKGYHWRAKPRQTLPDWAVRTHLSITTVACKPIQEVTEEEAALAGAKRLNAGQLGMETWASALHNFLIDCYGRSWSAKDYWWFYRGVKV